MQERFIKKLDQVKSRTPSLKRSRDTVHAPYLLSHGTPGVPERGVSDLRVPGARRLKCELLLSYVVLQSTMGRRRGCSQSGSSMGSSADS